MSVPRPKRRAAILLYPALLSLLLTGLALCLPRLAPGARASRAVFNATLGNYADTSIELGKNTAVTPDAAPVDATSINVSTSTLFKGTLEADPTTGVVRVTNAHPAGTYAVKLIAFDPNTGTTDSKSFQLTVTTTAACSSTLLGFQSVTLPAGTGSSASAIGDFNGDGKQDIATANNGANNISVRLGDGAGGFGAPTTFAAGNLPRALAVADFGGDGRADIAVANSGGTTISILTGDGAGGFGAPSSLGVGVDPSSVATGDFNGDGRTDIVTANFGSNDASVLLADPVAGFGPATSFQMGGQPRAVAVGDFNNDGIQDIVTANNATNNISIRLGNAGGFGAVTNFAAGSKPESVVVGDFNNDGKQDIATANSGTNNFSVLLGDGSGVMAVAATIGTGASPFSIALGDFDGDGKQDLVTANSGTTTVSVFLGDGTGNFGGANNFTVGDQPRHVAVADFNGDGKQDIAASNFGSGNVSVLVRQCPPPAGTLVVTNTNDSGAGSLRQAITVSNNAAGVQTITFQILGAGVHTISPAAALPDITDRVVIDGFTQPGFAGTPLIELNGSGAGVVTAGLNVVSGGSTIRGLVVNNFNGHGVRLGTAGGNTVRADFIGTNPSGNAAQPNSGHGVFIDNTLNNTIGGAAAGDGNVISGNTGQGVRIDGSGATGNAVAGNLIGTDLSGAAGLPNTNDGVLLVGGASGNTIGATAGNTISKNGAHGVEISGAATSGNLILSNFIGTNLGGTAALGNVGSGVFIDNAPNNFVGGQGSGNVISANQNNGVLISGATATGNVVASNRIGTTENSLDPLGNGLNGVHVDTASGNTIGGMTDVEANTIAFNGQDGVQINSGTGNRILGNSLHDNGTTAQHLGIDLSPDGVNPNDAGDADTGANNRQNFPVVTSALLTGAGHIRIAGTLNSAPNATFRVEFFGGGACDASGFGEGSSFVNSADVMTDAAGNASFDLDIFPSDVATGDSVTATATNTATGDTSEFSQCVAALGTAIWNGSSDNNWHNGFNWNNDSFPSGSKVIIIPSTGVTNEPTIFASDADALSVIVQSGRTLTIQSGRTLTAPSGVTVNSGAVLNVTAGETGRVNGNINLNGALTGGAGAVFDFLGTNILNNATVSVPTFRFAGTSQSVSGAGTFTSGETFILGGSTVTLGTSHELDALTVNSGATLDQSGNSTLTVGKLTVNSGGLFKNLGSGDLILKGDVANAGTIQLNGAGAACGDADTILISSSAAGAQRAWSGSGSFQLTDVEVRDQAGTAAIQVLSGTNSGNVGPNWTFANCGGVPLTFAISGHIVNGSSEPIVGVNVHLDGTTARDTTTDANGSYTFAGLAQQGNFTVTPTETNYRFTPPSRSVNNLQSDQTAVDFTGALVNHTIAGTILDGDGHGISGVTVTLAGAQSALTTTDADGNYSFTNVPEGGSFTLTPDKEGFTFNPPRQQVPNIIADVDFDAVATAQATPTPTPDPSDDFSGGPNPDFDKWNIGILTNPPTAFDPLVQVFLAGGLLHIQPRDNSNGLSFSGLVSARALDLDSTPVVSVEVVAASQGEGAQTLFGLGRDQNNWLRFAVQDTTTVSSLTSKPSLRASASGGASNDSTGQTLLFEINAGGSKTSFGIDYDPSQQRFWRFRFDAPARTVIFETSPDSATWTVRFTAALPADQTALIAELSAGTFKATVAPTEALFDNYLLSPTPRVQFSSASYSVNESDGTASVQVIRTGSDESTAAVNFATSDGTAHAGSDYTATSGTILFGIGERTKTVTIPILNDNAIEGDETVNLTLTNSVGARLGSITNSVLTILDDESPNRIDETAFFVRQQYLDFLGREPDASGLQFWIDNIEMCGANAQCREVKRIDTSAAFFLSIEHQETGFVVQRFYEASFNRPPTFEEYLPDLTVIREGVIVGEPGAMARLETNKRLFADLWVNRAAFKQTFGNLNEMQYVDTLLANAGITLTEGERTALIVGLLTNRETRAGVLLKIVDKEEFKRREVNAAFVRMEYFGYLRRTPDPVGFAFWLKKLEDFGGDYRRAEMVKAFLSSTEYRARFGQP